MASGGNIDDTRPTLPIRGKVQKVRQQFAIHEDGAFASHLQNEEFDRHYGLNRFNRRTVREDLPIAKIVQTDEEIRQQNERFEELQALQAQAEEDAQLAKRLLQDDQIKIEANKMAIELTDEELAKSIQEKEKQKYERHLEKKKLQKLKKERESIEKTQAQRTEQARLHVRQSSGAGSSTDGLDEQIGDLNLQNGGQAMRVTPAGAIEDDGDFSDFYNLPEHIDPSHKQVLQEMQDEELARLLQEQEHKRNKASVDKDKLREIEEQDKRLAEIIQEQEKIRLKKAKLKWRQQEEARRAQEAAQRPPALPPRNQEHNHRRYRRNSFIQSMENGPTDEGPSSPESEEYLAPMDRRENVSQNSSHGARANADRQVHSERISVNANQQNRTVLQVGGGDPRLNNTSVKVTSNEIRQNQQNVQRVKNNIHGNQGPPRSQAGNNPSGLPPHDMPDVERWLASQPPDASRRRLRSDDSEHLPDSPSPPGSYHSEDAFQYMSHSRSPHNRSGTDTGSHYAVSDPFNFNIATAIDPTYNRRTSDGIPPGRQGHPHHVHSAQQRPVSIDDDCELEWEPVHHGSLRRTSLLYGFHDNNCRQCHDHDHHSVPGTPRDDTGNHGNNDASAGAFLPVQGQKRTGGERTRKPQSSQHSSKDKSNCKQQ